MSFDDIDFSKGSSSDLLKKVKELIAVGVDPSENNNMVLVYATMYDHLVIVEELLKDSRVNPLARACSAHRIASQRNYLDILEVLMRHPKFKMTKLSKQVRESDPVIEVAKRIVNQEERKKVINKIGKFKDFLDI